MKDSLNELIGKVNLGLRGMRELFVQQGKINTETDARIVALNKRIEKLEEALYLLCYNLDRGVNDK